jgi:hypothetical protein
MTAYEHPANGYREVGGTGLSWLWCLLFGFFYFAFKGVWVHALVGFFLAICTSGLSWLIYPFFARGIVDRGYLKRGWRVVTSGPPPTTAMDTAEQLRIRAIHQA